MTTVKEYAQENNVTTRTVYRWIDEGKIQAEKVDGKLVIIGDISTTPNITEEKEKLMEQLRNENEYLRKELLQTNKSLADANQRLDEAQKRYDEAQERHDSAQQQSNMIIMQLTRQLENQNRMLEDMKDRSIWKRIKAVLGFSPGHREFVDLK